MNPDVPTIDEWDPLSPAETADLFAGFPGFWAIAGGWAIDLFLGEQTRSHADIDIQIDRRDASLLHGSLPGWQLYLANRYVCEWTEGTPAPDVVSDIWCRRPDGPWQFQMMLGHFDEGSWYYKRDHAITGPIPELTVEVNGVPVIAPEVQMLYKARTPRPRDEADFEAVLPRLEANRRVWLADALTRCHPTSAWIDRLKHSQ